MDDLLDQSALEALADALVGAARRAGADQADAIALRGVSLAVEVREGRVEETERAESDDVGLRVIVGGRQAVVSTSAIRGAGKSAEVAALAERAVAMARVAPVDPHAGLADTDRLARSIPDLDLVDRTPVDVARLEALAYAAEGAALAVPGVTRSGGVSASWRLSGVVLATSHGFRGSYLVSTHGLSATAIAGEGTGMERDWEWSATRHAADLMDPAKVGRTAGERAVRRLAPRKVETDRLPVIYDARVAGSLVGHLGNAVSGTSVARRTSFLQDRLGQALFAPGIRIIDDPLRPRGLASRPFDAEGVACATLAIVEDGVLASWLLDSATGRELGLGTTGHASRGVSSAPGPSSTNLYMAAGTISREDLIRSVPRGIYVTDLIGMGVNPVTGDYSRGASGFRIENGELGEAVSEITIAGNLVDMYRSIVPASDLTFRYATDAPTLLVEGLTIAGR